MLDLPSSFILRMRDLLGDEYESFRESFERTPAIGLRVNTLKIAPDQLIRIAPWPLDPVPWCPAGFFVEQRPVNGSPLVADHRPPTTDHRPLTPGKHFFHAAGLYYLQEPSAMAVAEALDVQPGHRVLDLAAAPGGKATHLAALMGDRGLLVANEIERSRIKALGENLERWGGRNVVITNDSPERLASRWAGVFDRVLLDAPCSGEGMFRKNPAALAEWSVEHVIGCAIRQGNILESAARLVKPGGLLVYSTCTFAPEENEQRIAAFLRDHPGWQLESIPLRPGFAPARPDWADPPLPELTHAVRLWPHLLRGEGHFIARLRKPDRAAHESSAMVHESWSRRTRVRRESSGERASAGDSPGMWRSFARESLRESFSAERLMTHGDQIYLAPDLPLDLDGVRGVRSGLWLGTIKPGRFEPSHALALALRPDEARQTADLDHDSTMRYLRGETIDRTGPDGWTLMTIDGFALGWGRRVRGVIKNFYPKGLRRAG
jgi:NOL1/NOP2/sun family putative RNA methylase